MKQGILVNDYFLCEEEYNKYVEMTYKYPEVKIVHVSANGLHQEELKEFALHMFSIPEQNLILESDFAGDLSKAVRINSSHRYVQIQNLYRQDFRRTFEGIYGNFDQLAASYVALHESITNSAMVDDGPAVFFKDLQSYRNRSDRFAAMLGWKVQAYTIHKELELFDTDYPNGPGNYPVSWGPIGDVSPESNTRSPQVFQKWKQNTEKTLSSLSALGWKFSKVLDKTYDG